MPKTASHQVYNGFWLPGGMLESLVSEVTFAQQTFAAGRPAQPGTPGAVTVRWPILDALEYSSLAAALDANRRKAPDSRYFWPRFQAALRHAACHLADPADPLHQRALAALPGYTGYSPAMIEMTLQAMDWFSLAQLPKAFQHPPVAAAIHGWQPLHSLPGWIRFYPQPPQAGLAARLGLPIRLPSKQKLYEGLQPAERVVGYGSGNVPGAALLIGLLAQSVVLGGQQPPAVLLRNSRREPIFTPLVLEAMAEVDPDLVCATAVMVWDYEDPAIQAGVLSWADTVIAAASDETIGQIRSAQQRVASIRQPRFQPHGHKVSFALIGGEMFASGARYVQAARLAALDSVFWDQNGCLSARIHFVEQGSAPVRTSQEFSQIYAEALAAAMRRLAVTLPRGAWPRRELHERFDRYKALEAAGLAQVFSGYDDDFLVFIDFRVWDDAAFRQAVNDCQGRTIIVRAVHDRMQVPETYLRRLPSANLQSLSIAAGRPGQRVDERLLDFAAACGRRGVTALRSVGRGAFPQLAYSWDGYIPYDLVAHRAAGRFCTIEFDAPCDEMLETYRMLARLFDGDEEKRVL